MVAACLRSFSVLAYRRPRLADLGSGACNPAGRERRCGVFRVARGALSPQERDLPRRFRQPQRELAQEEEGTRVAAMGSGTLRGNSGEAGN